MTTISIDFIEILLKQQKTTGQAFLTLKTLDFTLQRQNTVMMQLKHWEEITQSDEHTFQHGL